MRIRLVVLTLCTSLLAGAAAAEPPPERDPYAVRVEGTLGAAIVDGGSLGDDEALDVGGAGSVVGLLGPAFLQLDVFGDYVDWGPHARNVGFGGHLGLKDQDLGAVAVTGAYQQFVDDEPFFGVKDEYWRTGGEGEVYLDRFTLGTEGGYLRNGDTDDDGWYARGFVRVYPTENLKLEGVGGYADFDSDGLPLGRFLIEYRPGESWLSFFARWEGTFDNDVFGGSFDQHAAVLGVRLYLDSRLSLRETDRIYFRDSCVSLNIRARLC